MIITMTDDMIVYMVSSVCLVTYTSMSFCCQSCIRLVISRYRYLVKPSVSWYSVKTSRQENPKILVQEEER